MTSSLSHAQGELLAQVRPGVTTPVTLFEAGELRTEVTLIMVGHVGSGGVIMHLYHDDNGVAYSAANEICHKTISPTDDCLLFQAQHPGSGIMIKSGGSLGVEIDTANDLVFSVYGVTETLADRVRPGVR